MQTEFAAGNDNALSCTGIAGGGGPPKLRREREKQPRRPAPGVLPHRARPPRIPRQDIGREALRDAYHTLPDPVPVEMRIALRRLLLRMPEQAPAHATQNCGGSRGCSRPRSRQARRPPPTLCRYCASAAPPPCRDHLGTVGQPRDGRAPPARQLPVPEHRNPICFQGLDRSP